MRIFALARELDMESKDLLALCQQHGLDVRNQLSTIEPEQRDQILDLVKKGPGQPATQAPPPPAAHAPGLGRAAPFARDCEPGQPATAQACADNNSACCTPQGRAGVTAGSRACPESGSAAR